MRRFHKISPFKKGKKNNRGRKIAIHTNTKQFCYERGAIREVNFSFFLIVLPIQVNNSLARHFNLFSFCTFLRALMNKLKK